MKKTKRAFIRVLTLFTALTLLVAMTVLPAGASSTNKVNEVTKGVFLVVYTFPPDPDQPNAPDRIGSVWSMGTGFLINENTLITAYHVLHDEDVHDALQAVLGPGYRNQMQIRVYYKAGAFLYAEEIQEVSNASYDFTALRFKDGKSVNGALQLTLADDVSPNTVVSPMPVYSLGYPYTTTLYENFSESTFTPEDVDTKNGIVNKFETYQGINLIKHTAMSLSGMSGGPLVTADGVVIGINRLGSTLTESEHWAVPMSTIIDTLDKMNIEYKSAHVGSPNTQPSEEPSEETPTEETPTEAVTVANTSALEAAINEAAALKAEDYKSGFDKVLGALGTARSILGKDGATQDEVDAATNDLKAAVGELVPASRINLGLIIGIAAAALVVLAVVIVLVVVLSKKKKNDGGDAPVYAPPAPPMPPQGGFNPPAPQAGFTPAQPTAPRFTPAPPAAPKAAAETSVLSTGSETTVLGSGGNETTVLKSQPYATLTRKSSGEKIPVAAAKFVIGKERRKVNYCIEDNSTVSRAHAQIEKAGAKVVVTDLGSTNGTFVNGVKCAANVAVDLKSGDKLTISDEEFTVTVL